MLKFRRRRTVADPIAAGDAALRIGNLLDEPRLRALVGEIDPNRTIRPVALDWPTQPLRPVARRRHLLRAA